MATREGDLAELKGLVLESMRETLVRNLNPTNVLPYLRSKFVVDAYESDLIKNCCSKSLFDGADKLIDVLLTKGNKGYDEFCEAILHGQTQVHLLKAMNKRLELVKHAKKQQQTQTIQTQPAQDGRAYNPLPSYGHTPQGPNNRMAPGSAHTTTCIGPPAPTPQLGPPYISRSPCPQPNMQQQNVVWMGHAVRSADDDRPGGQSLL